MRRRTVAGTTFGSSFKAAVLGGRRVQDDCVAVVVPEASGPQLVALAGGQPVGVGPYVKEALATARFVQVVMRCCPATDAGCRL
jgi:hypothetical protein